MKRDRHILQKYLDNELSESELTRFEQELNASQELLVDLDLYKEVDEAIADTEVLDFRAQLTDLREETKRSDTGRRVFRFTRPWHYAATAALALLVAIGLATFLGRPLSNSDLFAKYMKPYELVLTNRSIDNEYTQVLMSKAEAAYLSGDFEGAIGLYDEILEIKGLSDVVLRMGPQLPVLLEGVFRRFGGQDDQRDRLELGVLLELVADGEPVHFRELDR